MLYLRAIFIAGLIFGSSTSVVAACNYGLTPDDFFAFVDVREEKFVTDFLEQAIDSFPAFKQRQVIELCFSKVEREFENDLPSRYLAYVEFDFQPKSENIYYSPRLKCSREILSEMWNCEASTRREFRNSVFRVVMGDGIDRETVLKVIRALERYVPKDEHGSSSYAPLESAELAFLRSVTLRRGGLTAVVGKNAFSGFDLTLRPIVCGLSDCELEVVSYSWWIS